MTSGINDRPYLSIGEVLGLLLEEFPDVTISKIRFLESQGLIVPERTASGYRKFFDADVDRLRMILREQRENFLPLRVIRDRLGAGSMDDATPPSMPTPAVAAPAPRGLRNVRLDTVDGDTVQTGRHPAAKTRTVSAPLPSGAPEAAEPPAAERPAAESPAAESPAAESPAAEPPAAESPVDVPAGLHAQVVADGSGDPAREVAALAGVERADAAAEVTPEPGPSGATDVAPEGSSGAASAGGDEVPDADAAPTAPLARPVLDETGGLPRPAAPAPPPPPAAAPTALYVRSEVCAAAGITAEQLIELESFGVVTARGAGTTATYTDGDLAIIRAAAGFLARGFDARHLRSWRQAAEREASLFEQRILPLLRQRNPQARQDAVRLLHEMAELGAQLREAIVLGALRHHLDP